MTDRLNELGDDPEPDFDGPWVLEPTADDTDRVLDALGSRTTRTLFWRLHETPSTTSELAEYADCSVQNAYYHVRKLESAGLVETIGTRYSENGGELTVYAPQNEAVMLAGRTDGADRYRDLFAGALASVLALVTVVLAQFVAEDFFADATPSTPTGPAWVGEVGTALTQSLSLGAIVGAVVAAIVTGVVLARWPP